MAATKECRLWKNDYLVGTGTAAVSPAVSNCYTKISRADGFNHANMGSGIAIYLFILLIVDITLCCLLAYVAFKLIKENKCINPLISIFAALLLIKQIFNTIFKIYLCFECVARAANPTYTKPDSAFYGLYGTSVVLFMIIIAVNMNIQFNYYITMKEYTEVLDP